MSDEQRQRWQQELDHLQARRRQLLEQRVSVSSLGGDDFGGGMRSEQWRNLNKKIDAANDIGRVETRISELQRLIADD